MWFYFSIITLVLWGMWGFLAKVSSNHIGPRAVYLWGSVGALVVTIISIFVLDFHFEIHPKGMLYALIAGLAGGGGVIFFYYALRYGKASVVVAITALYPLVTLGLSSFFLKEGFSLKQIIGMLLAIVAILLMVE